MNEKKEKRYPQVKIVDKPTDPYDLFCEKDIKSWKVKSFKLEEAGESPL